MCLYVFKPCVCGVWKPEELNRSVYPKLQLFVNSLVWCWEENVGPVMEQQEFLSTESPEYLCREAKFS